MKQILLFGAGKSASVLIEYLLENASAENWQVTIADADRQLIEEKTKGHTASTAVTIDIKNDDARKELISKSDLVISMMPPALHILIAKDCAAYGKHLLTASYADDAIKALANEVKEKGIIFLCEMGLDPGIDHMSALKIIHELKEKGGKISSFKSHCGGLVAPESDNNPWHYKISWNPRNVVLAGKAGAEYLEDGKIINEEYSTLFNPDRKIDTGDTEIGSLSYYPNRNSLPYIDLYELNEISTFVRTTLRYRDYMLGWKNIIDLQLTDETIAYNSDGLSLSAFFHHHFEKHGLTEILANELKESEEFTSLVLKHAAELMNKEDENPVATAALSQTAHDSNKVLQQLYFLGLNDEETMINKGMISAADGLQFALEKKLLLSPADKDMIVMQHDIEYELENKKHQLISSLIVKGKDSVHTAMAKTVGLPLGIAAKLILNGKINLTGLHLPVIREIYLPVLEELEVNGIVFEEKNVIRNW